MSEAVLGAPARPAVLHAKRALPTRALLVFRAAVAAAGAGTLYIATPNAVVATDDAYVGADVSTVAPRIRGLVAQVAVRDNQHVRAGDILVRIDSEEYDARLTVARADLRAANATVLARRAALAKLDAEQRLAHANLHATATAIRAADAETTRAGLDLARFDELAASGAVSRRDADRTRAASVAASADSERSRAALQVSRAQADVTDGQRAELRAAVAQAQAAEARAAGMLTLAEQDAAHATIRARVDGVVGERHVQPGTALMSLVPMDTLYVTANFKETQTARMRPGQHVELAVDALGERTLQGEVESIAPGSGSQFALLPFEPGTGNFTKIVQRLPVRVRADPGPLLAALRPGLSAVVRVRVGE